MKKLFFYVVMIVSIPVYTLSWPWKKKPSATDAKSTAAKNMSKKPIDTHAEINKLINIIEQLKKENAALRTGRVSTTTIANNQTQQLDAVKDILSSIDQEEKSNDNTVEDLKNEIEELNKQVDYLGRGWMNTIKTIEANLNAPALSTYLSKNLEKLDDQAVARKINEEIANATYRLKFMYTESRYLLDWMNKKINWQTAASKGIVKPDISKDFSNDQIKKMVMAVEVK